MATRGSKTAGVKAGRIHLTIGCLVFVITVCTLRVGKTQVGGDPPAKYVITFGQAGAPIDLANRAAFILAVKDASWRRNLLFAPPENGFPPEATGQTQAASTIHLRAVSQDRIANPNSQQVTQRVGFRRGQEQLMNALLAQVKE